MPGTGDVTTLTQLKMQTSLPGRQTVNLDIYPFRQYIYIYICQDSKPYNLGISIHNFK